MKNIEQQKRQCKRQLTAQYMVVVTLVLLVSLSSLLVLEHILKQQEGYAAVINMSGRQRMLSQRISQLAHEIVYHNHEELQGEQLEQIQKSIALMQQSHQHLISGKVEDNSGGVELSDKISGMYFQPPLEVDKLVREYLTGIKALLAEPVSKRSFEELSSLSITARGVLLDALNTVVQQYEVESVAYSDILKNSALGLFLLMVLLLVVVVLFGFRPMVNVVTENESMLNSILDSIPILMDIVNKDDGTILYQSTFLINLLGTSTIGQKYFEAYKTDQIQYEFCPIHQTEQDLDTRITTCFDRFGDGAVVEITHLRILFKGREAILHTFQDITEQKKTEDFLIRAKEEADHASELKSNFLANMSHEIRTPMNAIIGFSDLALETVLDTQQQDYLKTINRSSHSLLKIINKILDFSKIEAGKLDLENNTFSLEEILQNLVSLFAGEAEEKNIVLNIYQQADIPVLLMGDGLRLEQILTNLLANSFKFTDKGEITAQVSLESLSVQQVRIVFSVTDSGIGIASDKLLTLFDPFSQADSSTTRKYGGTGLGLAICRQLVELLGGTLKVSSTEGVGTIFSFTAVFGLVAADGQTQLVKGLFVTRQGTDRREKDRRRNTRDRRKNTKTQSLPENLPGVNRKIMLDDNRKNVAVRNERVSPPDQERVAVLLAELETLLAGKNFQADRKWQELKPLLVAVDKSILMRITRSLEQFDYTTALELLVEMEGYDENIQ